jgi:hypothetical protein
MQGLLFPGDREVQVALFPDPMPGPGEVVVAMRAAARLGRSYSPGPRRAPSSSTSPSGC